VIERGRERGWDDAGELLRDAHQQASTVPNTKMSIVATDEDAEKRFWEMLTEIVGDGALLHPGRRIAVYANGSRIEICCLPEETT
jgi:hypothetical protein